MASIVVGGDMHVPAKPPNNNAERLVREKEPSADYRFSSVFGSVIEKPVIETLPGGRPLLKYMQLGSGVTESWAWHNAAVRLGLIGE